MFSILKAILNMIQIQIFEPCFIFLGLLFGGVDCVLPTRQLHFKGNSENDPNANFALKSSNLVLFFWVTFWWSRLCSPNSPTQLWTSNKTIPKYKQESPRTQVAYNAFSRPFMLFFRFQFLSGNKGSL